MKRLHIVLALAAAAVSATGTVGTAGAATGSTIKLTGRVSQVRVVVDAKPKGRSAGDIASLSGVLFSGGKRIGRYGGTCIQLAGGNQQCSFTLGLPKGQIALSAGYGPAMNTSAVALEAVIGGTGAYEGARGQAKDRETGETTMSLEIHLLP